MPTDTKHRTKGELTTEIHGKRTYLYGSGHKYIGEVDVEHAEYIRKAWNMHEELVAGIKEALSELREMVPPYVQAKTIEGCQNPQVQEHLVTLLAKAQ